MSLSFPMKCKVCDARYHLRLFDPPLTERESTFYQLLGELFLPALLIPLAILFFWLKSFFIWPVVLLTLLTLFMVLRLLLPHRINPKDPVNAIVQRIQDKKNKS